MGATHIPASKKLPKGFFLDGLPQSGTLVIIAVDGVAHYASIWPSGMSHEELRKEVGPHFRRSYVEVVGEDQGHYVCATAAVCSYDKDGCYQLGDPTILVEDGFRSLTRLTTAAEAAKLANGNGKDKPKSSAKKTVKKPNGNGAARKPQAAKKNTSVRKPRATKKNTASKRTSGAKRSTVRGKAATTRKKPGRK